MSGSIMQEKTFYFQLSICKIEALYKPCTLNCYNQVYT